MAERRSTPGPAERLVLAYLLKGPQPAGMVGAHVWRGKKRGRVTSVNGGGDYGAQMMLGRMRRQGWVRAGGEGTSIWELTEAGRRLVRSLEMAS